MDFLVLSLPEAASLYMGLAIQALARASSLRHVPFIMVLIWTLVLIWRAAGHPHVAYKVPAGYLVTSLIFCILFWPEVVPFGEIMSQTTDSTRIASYAAIQDPDAEVKTAEDTEQVPASLRPAVRIPAGFRLLLRGITETPLALARVINSHAHQTFGSLMPLAWFLEVQLPADQMAAVADWTASCYVPTLLEMMNGESGRTIEDLLPFGDSPLRQQLAMHSVIPSSQNGITWIRGPGPQNLTLCTTYLAGLELSAQRWLAELKSPKGTPYLELFEAELGLMPPAQASILLYREMLHAAGPGVPAPSLVAQYAKLRGTNTIVDVVAGTGSGAIAGGWAGAGWGALTGLFRGIGGDFQAGLNNLSWLVRTAMICVWYGPYVAGIINLVLIGLYPFVLIWSLIPGSQFQVLASYWMALLLTSSIPLFWALIDQAARLASQQPPVTEGAMGAVWSAFIFSGMWSASITAIGILLIPVVVSILYFVAFRGLRQTMRGVL